MRTVHADIASRERGRVLLPRTKLTLARLAHKVDTPTLASNDSSSSVSHSYTWDGLRYYAAWRHVNGRSLVSVSTDGGIRLADGTVINDGSAVGTMRNFVAATTSSAGSQVQIASAFISGGAWQLKIATLGTSNPLSLSWANVGPTFGNGASNTSSLVRRIEGVWGYGSTRALAVEGRHDFTLGVSTLSFYDFNGSAWTQLNTIVNLPLTETYASWHATAQYATFIAAQQDPASGALVVVCNAVNDANGFAAYFTLRNGVESALYPVVDSDPDATAFRILPGALSANSRELYLAARITRRQTDSSGASATSGYDALMKYTHGAGFEFGGIGHYLCSARVVGGVSFFNDLARYQGSGWVVPFTLGALQGATAESDLSSRVLDWNLHQINDGADSFGLSLTDADGGLASLTDAVAGNVLRLATNQEGAVAATDPLAWTPIGQYVIDTLPGSVNATGRGARTLNARDLGRALMTDYVFQFGGQRRARGVFRSRLGTLDGLERVTPDVGYALTGTGLTVKGLNQPFVALSDAADHGDDALMRATVRFGVSDNYHLSSFGLVFGATADGKASVLLVPKANVWSGHSQPKPRLRKLALTAIDTSEPDRLNTGWTLESRMWGLFEAAGEASIITADAGATYPTDNSYAVPVDTDTDIAVRVSGRFAQVFTKQRVMGPAQIAQYAEWTLRTIAQMGTARKRFGAVTRMGLAAGTDVYAAKTAFAGAFYADQELQLTDAASLHSPRAGAYETPITGTVTEQEGTPGQPDVAISGSGTAFLTELRVGQTIRLGSGGNYHTRVIANITSNTLLSCTTTWGPSGRTIAGPMYIRSSEFYGWASTAAKNRTLGGTETIAIDAGAVKRYLELGGYAVFISNDNTALQIKRIISNGIDHFLAASAWDATWPGGGGTSPDVWRMIFHQGLIAKATAASLGLPAGVSVPAYLICDDEVVRYAESTFTQFKENLSASSYANSTTWLVVPATYFVPTEQGNASSSVTAAYGSVSDAVAGQLFEISSRNAGESGYYARKERSASPQTKLQLYVVSNSGGTVVVGRYNAMFGTLAAATPDVALSTGDVAVCSGRGAFGSDKVAHDTDAPVAYYPCDSSGNPPTTLVSRFGVWSGLFASVQDAIARTAATAGLRRCLFRSLSRPVSPAYSASVTVANNSTTTLDLVQQVSDFVLDISNAYLPKSGSAWFSVYLRDYYRLDIAHAQHTAGTVNLRLQTTKDRANGGVDAYNGARTLEAVSVPVSPSDLSAAVTNRVALRVVAQGDELIVEIERQPVWTFDLGSLTDNTTSYYKTTLADVKLGNDGIGQSITVSLVVQEMGGEAPDVVMRAGQSAMDVIQQALGERRVTHRATADGGVEWGNWVERDDAGAFTENLVVDEWTDDEAQLVNHVVVTGDGVSGEAIDDAGARANGYRLDILTARAASTVAQAQAEAALALREAREYAVQRHVAGAWFSALQPEDRVQMSYTLGSTGIALSPVNLVITAIESSADRASITSRFAARRLIA